MLLPDESILIFDQPVLKSSEVPPSNSLYQWNELVQLVLFKYCNN